MKRLLLMRHAKSSWDYPELHDIERPLNKRGAKAATKIGREIALLKWCPQLVLSSNSVRTQQTWQLLSKELPKQPLVFFLPSLYHSGIGRIQAAIEFIHPQTESILILGHNPGWTQAHEWLTGDYIEFKTASIAFLECDLPTWQEAIQTPQAWNRKYMRHPRNL